MNHFLALRPDGATRDRLQAVGDRLRAWELPATWTHPDDLHLTVLFLGDLADDEASYLPHAISDVAGSLRRPSLHLAGLGATGTRGGGLAAVPRAVYAAVADSEAACVGIHRDLSACIDEHPRAGFLPHLTLCRPLPQPAAGPLFRDWPHLLEAHGTADWGSCTVDALVLYRTMESGLPRYHELASWPLH